MFFFSPTIVTLLCLVVSLSLNFGEKAGGANHKLVGFTLQYHCGFSGSQRRPALKDVRFTSPGDLLAEIEPIKPEMILLGLDFFHLNFVSYHTLVESLNHNEIAPRAHSWGWHGIDTMKAAS
jgi:hypothetical protein